MTASLPRPSADDRIKAALWFADHGFRVFSVWSAGEDGTCRCPNGATCTSPGKHPITPHGFQDATQDAERIRILLSAGSAPNYGLVCPDGVFAWDLDGDGWQQQIATLEARFGALPPTLTTRTANGEHRFYRWPEAFPRPIGKMFGWVTRWGSGRDAGYVIGPRSIHWSGREYVPGTVFDIAVLPDAWAESVLGTDTPLDSPTITIGGYRLPDHDFDGSRYDEIRNYMASRYMRGLERDEIWNGVIAVLNPRFRHPLPESDLRARFDRAWAKIAERLGAPLDAPEAEDADTGEIIRRPPPADDLGILPARLAGEFPPDPDPAAFRGLIGECVMDIAPGTDASLVGLLGALLAFCGALVPGQGYFHRLQTTSPFIALVGESGVGRKGTAMMRAHGAMSSAVEPLYVNRAILDGLNSGEGLITSLAWKQTTFPHEPTVGLVFEEEFATLLASRGREGSTLDAKMRAAFDGGPLSNRRSAGTQTVLPPYWLPALIAVTPTELRLRLEAGALQSGSANRWLYLAVAKRDTVPTNDVPVLAPELRQALVAARRWAVDSARVLDVDSAVTTELARYSDFVATVAHGASRDLTRRLAVIAFRIALTHAMVERATSVSADHLERALAVTEYARQGIPWVFGEVVGSLDADLLLRNLVEAGRLTKNTITRGIIRDPIRQQAAIDELVRLGRAEVVTTPPGPKGGRPRTDLVPTAQTGGFVSFLQGFTTAPRKNSETLDDWDETPVSRSNGVDETWTTVEKTPLSLDETPHNLPDRHGWITPCRDYPHHMSNHRQTADGWICDICSA